MTRTCCHRLFWACVVTLGCGLSAMLDAQSESTGPASPFSYVEEDSFAGDLQTPSEFFSIPLGDRFTPHHDVMRYCGYVADNSPHVAQLCYGQSAEGRDLILLFVSSEQNIARLDEIREQHARLADPRGSGEEIDGDDFLKSLPAVVWLSFNVHGNESSATEAALRQLYHLADGNDSRTERMREQAVVIIDPLLNPDGRERYLQWYHSVAQGNPDPNAREHDEPWPGGRTNHYYFDLNRDWAWLSQIETRVRIAEYLRWQPLVHVDVHEMSPESSYFFFPAEPPINTNFPDHTLRWGRILGGGNAAAFDRRGWRYYTEEEFDLFYPGYGDSWPSLHGSIGMTFEQAGGSRAGLSYRRRDGHVLTLRERTHHHLVACMATVDTAVARKLELQRSFLQFRRESVALGKNGPVAEFVFPPARVPQRLLRLANLLRDQGVEVHRTTVATVGENLHGFDGKLQELVKLPVGTLIVSLDQPAARLAKALLEPEAKITENKFYDVSAWSLPFAMGVDAYWSGTRLDVTRELMVGREPRPGRVSRRGSYAYLMEWRGTPAVQALLRLQKFGAKTRLAPKAFTLADREYPAGTLVVPATENADSLFDAVTAIARELGVDFYGVDSGWTEKGIDLGSDQVTDLVQPRIAVATGPGISSSSFGAIWYLFERELELPFCAFALEELGSLELHDYNVLVIPSGSIRSVLDDRNQRRLREWLEAGGTLVAIGRSAADLGVEGVELTQFSTRHDSTDDGAEDSEDDGGESDEENESGGGIERRKIADLTRSRRERQVPGNIFRVDLDSDHPLSFGLPQSLYAFMSGTRTFALTGGAGDVGMLTDDPAVSGYITEKSVDRFKRRVYLAHQDVGRGQVVLFADDPNFRLFWRGTTPLFLNAVILLAR